MGKVSILTPCYNGEEFLGRFFNSIINQTYKNIELIIVDDGSTDSTSSIIIDYNNKFVEQGISFISLYQENQGQAAAINNALAYATGDYLCWIDSDDLISPDSIEKKVKFLEENKGFGLVRTSGKIYNENDLNKCIGVLNKKERHVEEIFDGLINETIGCTPGRYMIRMEAFNETNPNKQIYNSRSGQNWQMLLPVSYKYKCGYIDEYLFSYIVRQDSHSHSDENVSYEVSLKKIEGHKDILINIIEEMFKNKNEKEYFKYKKIICNKYLIKQFRLSCKYGKTIEINKLKFEIKSKKIKVPKKFIFLSYSILVNIKNKIIR